MVKNKMSRFYGSRCINVRYDTSNNSPRHVRREEFGLSLDSANDY